jgi:hypothetical protein
MVAGKQVCPTSFIFLQDETDKRKPAVDDPAFDPLFWVESPDLCGGTGCGIPEMERDQQ